MSRLHIMVNKEDITLAGVFRSMFFSWLWEWWFESRQWSIKDFYIRMSCLLLAERHRGNGQVFIVDLNLLKAMKGGKWQSCDLTPTSYLSRHHNNPIAEFRRNYGWSMARNHSLFRDPLMSRVKIESDMISRKYKKHNDDCSCTKINLTGLNHRHATTLQQCHAVWNSKPPP